MTLSPNSQHVWEEEWGASGDPYAFINQEQFITNMEHVVNTKNLRKKVASPLPFFFQVTQPNFTLLNLTLPYLT